MNDVSVTENNTPPLKAFAGAISSRLDFGQAQIRRLPGGFELRHVADRERDDAALQLVEQAELRRLAQFTASGAFRPLKSAPNLKTGWRAIAANEGVLGLALNDLYPGAVADWFAVESNAGAKHVPKITSYREFTNRQTGMYRITTMLDDSVATAMVCACCHRDFCLKRRLWVVNGLLPAADSIPEKSLIPCLEPCAILLEFARKIARVEQEEKLRAGSAPGQIAGQRGEGIAQSKNPDSAIAESDFNAPDNPRRLRFLLEKQRVQGKPQQRIAS
jgi:hypothetical protein